MAPEAPLDRTDDGLVPAGEGWFVLGAREARWKASQGRGARLTYEGQTKFPQTGASLFILAPGEAMGMYHWEADQEDFFVASGEPLLLIEGEERRLRPLDFVHCPAHTDHVIVGAGEGPSVILAFGARENQEGPDWGAYPVHELARRHGAGVEQETNDAKEAYAPVGDRELTRWREEWLGEEK